MVYRFSSLEMLSTDREILLLLNNVAAFHLRDQHLHNRIEITIP